MRISGSLALAVLSFTLAQEATADSELTFVFGASISGDFSALENVDFDEVQTAVKNSPLFGARVGSYGFPFGFEASLIYSPAALTGSAIDDRIKADASILYGEANLLVIILPGPVAPFFTVGGGVHYLNFNFANIAEANNTKLGYNWGGGLKVSASRLSLRVDIRDHVTTVSFDDVGLGIIAGILGFDESARLHNVELSFGVGIRF